MTERGETWEIRALDAAPCADWNRFVEAHPEGTFCHLAEWGAIVQSAFGHRPHYLYATEDGRVRGVLPLIHVRSRLFGNALASTPFCAYGGAIADAPDVQESLEDHAAVLAERLGVDWLELRNLSRQRPDWPTKDLYVSFRKRIDPEVERNMLSIPRKQRAMVRKGIAAGLVSQIDTGIERFFEIYATSVRNLGTPVFPRRFFGLLHEVFGDRCQVLTVSKNGRAVSSVMSFYFRDEVMPYYGGGLPEARELHAFDFMYWEVMRRACEQGLRMFDYGRSKVGTGSFSFKRNWGFEPQTLRYQYRLVCARAVPEVNPLNPKYRLLIALWKKLPLPIANSLGPLLSRSLG